MMLCVIFCPQKTVLLTGVFPTVQTYAAGTPSLGSRASGALGLSTLPFTSSTFPLRSTARTWSTCSAGVSPLTGCGELHVVHSGLLGVTGSIAPSSRQWKTRPSVGVWLSLPSKVNVALVSTVVGSGPERIFVSGGVVSGGGGWIHHVCVAAVPQVAVLLGRDARLEREHRLRGHVGRREVVVELVVVDTALEHEVVARGPVVDAGEVEGGRPVRGVVARSGDVRDQLTRRSGDAGVRSDARDGAVDAQRLAGAALLSAVLLDARLDPPGVLGGGEVEVAGLVDRAHLEVVVHGRLEAQEGLRARALRPELALRGLGHLGRLVRVRGLEVGLLRRQRRVGRRVEAALEPHRGQRVAGRAVVRGELEYRRLVPGHGRRHRDERRLRCS